MKRILTAYWLIEKQGNDPQVEFSSISTGKFANTCRTSSLSDLLLTTKIPSPAAAGPEERLDDNVKSNGSTKTKVVYSTRELGIILYHKDTTCMITVDTGPYNKSILIQYST